MLTTNEQVIMKANVWWIEMIFEDANRTLRRWQVYFNQFRRWILERLDTPTVEKYSEELYEPERDIATGADHQRWPAPNLNGWGYSGC